MTDTKLISKAALKSQATGVDQPTVGVPAVAALHVPGSVSHPDWLPIPAPADEADAEVREKSHQRALGNAVMEELRAGDRLERRVWLVLSVCSAVTILYAAYCYLFGR
jgi:hypothetical protein